MASIDAFWDLAAREPAPKPALRISLQRLGPAAGSTIDNSAKRQRALILIGIALLHVLMLVVLRVAMQPPKFARAHAAAPLQINFIELRPSIAIPRPMVVPAKVPHPRATPASMAAAQSSASLQRLAPRPDALQAVTIAPRTVAVPADVQSPKASFYSPDGALLAPAATGTSPPPRDLLAHKSADWMLPGGARRDSPDFHVRDAPSPEDAVNTVAGIVGALIGGVAARPDQNGIVLPAPDRGLRTSGRDTDPCEDIALDNVDLDASENERAQAEERYEKSCEGH